MRLLSPFGPKIGHYVLSDNEFELVEKHTDEILNDSSKKPYGRNLGDSHGNKKPPLNQSFIKNRWVIPDRQPYTFLSVFADAVPNQSHIEGHLKNEPYFEVDDYPEMRNLFRDRVIEYIEELMISFNVYHGKITADISQAWIVDQTPGEYNPVHTHGDCNISAVLYIKVPEEIKHKIKMDTTKYPHDGCLEFINGCHREAIELELGSFCIPPIERHLYIFPARLQHLVYPFNSSNHNSRISLSFNATASISRT